MAGCVAADSREPTRLAALPPSPAIRRHQPGPQSAPKFTFWNDVFASRDAKYDDTTEIDLASN